MQKILVTTDFSSASKAGLRFAIQLATQMDVELVFLHCFESLIPTSIHRQEIEAALQEQTEEHLERLRRMVADLHKSMQITPGKHDFVVLEHWDIDKTILDYARAHGFDYLAMSTHGAGLLDKLIGSHSASIIQRSEIPVFLVPHSYRVQPLHKLLYSSDLENFDPEMAVVSVLASALDLKTDLVHFYSPESAEPVQEETGENWRQKYPQLDSIYLKPLKPGRDFSENINAFTRKTKPSLLIFFAHVHKNWFDKVFGKSLSSEVPEDTNLPMLVYRKIDTAF